MLNIESYFLSSSQTPSKAQKAAKVLVPVLALIALISLGGGIVSLYGQAKYNISPFTWLKDLGKTGAIVLTAIASTALAVSMFYIGAMLWIWKKLRPIGTIVDPSKLKQKESVSLGDIVAIPRSDGKYKVAYVLDITMRMTECEDGDFRQIPWCKCLIDQEQGTKEVTLQNTFAF